jgi:iron complex outermembrane receptor protein
LAGGLGVGTSAFGQTAPSAAPTPTPSAAPPAEMAELAEVVVTARRREESAQKVPVSISSISNAAIEDRHIENISEVQFLVPSLRITPSLLAGTFVDFALRGLRSTGVVTYFSEVPANAAAVGNELYDLDSIQVLKGPQGTLFGKNTTAGAVLIRPARPTDSTDGYVEFGAGDYGLRTGQAMFNTPLSDKLWLRVSGQFTKRDGTLNVVAATPEGQPQSEASNSIDSVSARISLLYKPMSGIENLLIVDVFNADQSAAQGKIVESAPCPANPAFVQTVILGACRYGAPWQAFFNAETAVGPRNTLNPTPAVFRDSTWGVSDLSSFALNDNLTIKNIFGWRSDRITRDTDGDGTPFSLFYGDELYKYRFYSDEAQLQGTFDRVKFVVGAFYSNNRTDTNELFSVAIPSFLDPITRYGTLTDVNKALYSQGTYAVTERFNLTAGFRYTWDQQHFVQHDFTGALGCSYATNDIFADHVNFATCTFDQAVSFKEPSWTFSADYQLTDKILAYATTRKGFNAGGINSSPPTAFGTEKINDVEVGLKSDLRAFDFPLRVNLSAFQSKYKDIQRSDTTFVGGQPKSIIKNAAAATVKGVELQTQALLGRFDLTANGTYLNAKYDRFPADIAPGVTVDLSGNRLAQAPKFSASVTAAYHLPVSANIASDLTPQVTWAYQSTIYFDDFNTNNNALPNYTDPFNTQAGYSLWNAELIAKDLMGSKVTATVYVKNLGNKLYAQNLTTALSSFGYATAIWGDPRMWGVTLRYRF